MPEQAEAEDGPQARGIDRLAGFSDAVVAIAITLLAIDLPVPDGRDVGALWESVRANGGHYAAFLISFIVIAAGWHNHHRVFLSIERADRQLRVLNTAWLLAVVLNPFATRLLTTRGAQSLDAHALRFGFYAVLQVLASAVLLAIVRHSAAHGLAPGMSASSVARSARSSRRVMLGFALSIPVFFATNSAWLLWFAVPWLLKGWDRLGRRRRPRTG
ncbi:TMEM175 family protein [Kitasatospora sp. NBC_01287]|uniref:TMEM175 family protein n=1 Tax=Kitasatospora sp. NBC_01287 TaxID=2903573 RepID=UPI00224F04A2|nr:TMEM175 family protein [Kitasatospora sp. NBC_01287]MCX4744456.1 TMEM175 family protein [Kitasatospora sp. NBC_01287]